MAVLFLGACRAPAPSAAASANYVSLAKREAGKHADASTSARDPSWSAAAALAECRQALEGAYQKPATWAEGRALQATCTGLVADAGCRDLLRRQWLGDAFVSPRLAAQYCADSYCPRLETRIVNQVPEVCAAKLPSSASAFWGVSQVLRVSMLEHDFRDVDVHGAVEAYVGVVEYMNRIPPPSSAGAPDAPPALQIELATNGGMRLRGSGVDLSVKSLAELVHVTPRARAGNLGVMIIAPAGVQYSQVIQLIDALRELGYENVVFGQPH
jgi:biopolymer transport protein ExbD